MTKTILSTLLLLAIPACSQTLTVLTPQATESSFKVEKIEPAKLLALKTADVELTKAAVALIAAQEIAKDAKDRYDTAKSNIAREYGAFEGECSSAGYASSRLYRRVEIRGTYALISEGQAQCPTSITLTTLRAADVGVLTPVFKPVEWKDLWHE